MPTVRSPLSNVVVALRREGLTYGQIAERLGITRSRVAGFLYRQADRERIG